MSHWPNRQNKRLGWSVPFALLLALLFFIQIEITLPGRAYTHFLGLNAAASESAVRDAGSLLIALQALLLATIIVPCLIWMTSLPARRNPNPSSITIRLGVCLWLAGAAISTLAHIENPQVVFTFIAGIGSATAVFYAVRRVHFINVRQIEAAFLVISCGALVPGLQGILGYYRMWGIPSVQTLLTAKYQPEAWQISSPFGNPDNVAILYCVLACPCLVILSSRLFTRTARTVAWILLICCAVNLVLTLARASFIVFGIALLCVVIFARSKRVWLISAVAFLSIAYLAAALPSIQDYFGAALRVDSIADNSMAERLDSIRLSWQHFLQNPVIGIGADQSSTFVSAGNAHQLAIWQATEHGAFGFLGVLLVTGGCIARLFTLLKRGNAHRFLAFELIFLLGPVVYFAQGLFAEVALTNTVVNTWICSVFSMLAIADSLASQHWSADVRRVPTPIRLGSKPLARLPQVRVW